MRKKIFLICSTLLLTACATTEQKETTVVYINSGLIQCETDGKTAEETAQILSENGINVTETKCGHLPDMAVIAMCGIKGTNINVHRVASEDLDKAEKLGFKNISLLKSDDDLRYEIKECE